MATCWSRGDIRRKLVDSADRFGSSNPQQLKQLRFSLERTDAKEVFFGLLETLRSAKSDDFHLQELCGYMLWSIRPPVQVPVDQFLRNILPQYELSVEEIPWYLVHEFGAVPVIAEIEKAKLATSSAAEERALDTLRYWIDRYHDG